MMQKTNVQPKHIYCLGIIGSIMLASAPAVTLAQIAGDGTLGTQVNGNLTAPCTGTCIITNGATRGSNLFHSFQQFSLPNGDFAGFVTTPTIQNVIVRVTGVGQPFTSNINGTIATSNPANFFLLNPNGIIFGPGATLNIGGSFLATTANRMQFADGTEFRTTDPAPLLTVSVPTGLQFNAAPGNIQMQDSFLSAGQTDSFSDFALVGGNVALDNSIVQTAGQRIELAGVGENGTVGLRLSGDRLSLRLPADTPRQDITLTNGSNVNAITSLGGGAVVATGRNIVLDASAILIGILPGIDNAATNRAGDITIDAAANLQLTQTSFIENFVAPNAIGQGGNIRIIASDLRVRDGSAISSDTLGNGNAGNVRVTATTATLDGTTPDSQGSSGIFSEVFRTGSGHGGDVTIETDSLTVTNGAAVSASTLGNGNGGNVQVTANTIALNGTSPDGRGVSTIKSGVASSGRGRGGDVTIETGSLTATNGGDVSAGTFGNGNGGNVQVTANTIVLNGTSPNGQFASGIDSQVASSGSGHGGNVSVETGSLTAINGAGVSANTLGNGDGGNVRVTANTIALDGTPPNGQGASGITSQVAPAVSGRGGDITIETGFLSVTNGAVVSASTLGNGDGGNVRVTANTIALDGTTPDSQGASAIGSNVESTGSGRGGDVTVETGSLNVTHGAVVSAGTAGNGNGGNVRVIANTIVLNGATPDGQGVSGIDSGVAPSGIGRGGNIAVQTDSLTVTNRAQVSSSAQGNGSAGNLDITARNLRLDNGGIKSVAFSGDGANINLTIGDLLLMRHGSEISTSAGLARGGGNGGNITIAAPRGFLVTAPNENNDITANAFNGSGGKVTINAQGIYWFTPRSRAELAQLLGTNDPAQLDPRRLPTNDITAISQGNPNLSGTVNLNILNLDPSRGLVALPVNLTDPSQQISQSCTSGDKTAASSFVSTGRGGIPLNPDEPLESRAVGTQWVALPGEVRGAEKQGVQRTQESGRNFNRQPSTSNSPAPIVEAQGWVVRADGTMALVADRPTTNPASVWNPSLACQMPQGR